MRSPPAVTPGTTPGATLAAGPDVAAALTAASDRTLGRVVGLLDGLVARGAADALLAGVRPRLTALRPARPLRFARLLVLPLEPALVAPPAWVPGTPAIPRSALGPMVEAVREALGDLPEEIETAALGRSMAEADMVGRLGARLWPLAAAARLRSPPPGWAEAGLPPEEAAPVLALARGLWRQGLALWAARRVGGEGQPAGG